MMNRMSVVRFRQYPRARVWRGEEGWIPQLPQLPYNCQILLRLPIVLYQYKFEETNSWRVILPLNLGCKKAMKPFRSLDIWISVGFLRFVDCSSQAAAMCHIWPSTLLILPLAARGRAGLEIICFLVFLQNKFENSQFKEEAETVNSTTGVNGISIF